MVTTTIPWIRAPGVLGGSLRLIKPPNVHADSRHSVVGAIKIRARFQHTFESRDRFRRLEALRGAPEDGRSRPVRFRKFRIQFQGVLVVVLRLFYPAPLTIDGNIDLHRY